MKSPRLTVLLGTLLLSQVALAADTRPTRPSMKLSVPPYNLDTQVWDFPSGLRVLLQEDHSHPIVSVFTVVDHGFQNDPDGKEELAHFVEHTWFRSVHDEWPPIMDVVLGHTSLFNATTHNDWTDYRTTMSSFYLEKLIAMEAYRLSEPYKGMTVAQVDVEREVIRNEWRRRNEQSSAQLLDYVNRYIYPKGHPYHRASSHESLTNIKLEDLQWYFDSFYKPSETTITIVGDFDPTLVMSYIFKHFDPEDLHPDLKQEHHFFFPKPGIEKPDQDNPDHWLDGYWDPSAPEKELLKLNQDPTKRTPRISSTDRPAVPDLANPELGHENAPVGVTTAVIGWSVPGAYRDDHWELMLLGGLASQAVNNGLRSVYREREYGDRIGEGTGCGTLPLIENSTVLCTIEIKDPKLDPEDVIEKALDQFATLWNPDYVISFNRQFDRARNEILRDTLHSLDNVASVFGGRAEDVGIHAHYTGDPRYHSEAMNQIMAVDGQKVAELGYQYLIRKRAARVIVEPLADEAIDTKSAQSSYAGASTEDALVKKTAELVPDDVIANLYTTVDVSKLVETTLPNGLRVVVMPHGEAPIVQASLLFGGGRGTLPKGIHDFVARFTESDGHDPLEIAGSTNYAYQQAILSPSDASTVVPQSSRPMDVNEIWATGWRMEFKAPSGNLDGVLYKLRSEAESIRPSLSTKAYWVAARERRMKSGWGSSGYHESALTNEHLFPGSVQDRPSTWEDLTAWKAWGAPEITAYLDRHVQPSNAALLIVGNIDPKEAIEIASAQFGSWQPKAGVETGWAKGIEAAPMPTAPARVILFDEPKRTQSDVSAACRLNYKGPEQDPAVQVLSSIANDDVFRTIRVKEGLSYTPGAGAYVRADGTAMMSYSSLTVNSGVGRMVEFTQQSIERIAKGEAPAKEVNEHKLKLANAGGVDAQSVDQLTNHLSFPIRARKEWSVLTDAGKNIASVNPDTLDDLVKDCLPHMITTIVGPKDVIGPQLDAKGIKYEVFDWKAAGDELLFKYDPKAAKQKEKAKAKEAEAEADDAGTDEDEAGDEG